MIHLDTHVVAWLYADPAARLPRAVHARLDAEDLAICPMVELELEYLFEIGRVAAGSTEVLAYLSPRIGLDVDDVSFLDVARSSARERWTRDPFDRLIVAHARLHNTQLVTKDRDIRAHYRHAYWSE